MAFQAGKGVIDLTMNTSGLRRGLGDTRGVLRRVGGLVAGLAASIGAAALVKKMVSLAADAEEMESKFKAVFKAQSAAADKWASDLALAVNRGKNEIKDSLATFQTFAIGLGFGGSEARKMSQELESLAIDFASFNNLTDDEAVQRFISAMSGSSEVLDRFGINIKAAALQQEALRQGLTGSVMKMGEATKASLRLSIIVKAMGSQGAIGDAAKTSGSFTNQLKGLQGAMADLGAEIGTLLLPALTDLIKWIRENAVPAVQNFVTAWKGLSAELKESVFTIAKWVAGIAAAVIIVPLVVSAIATLIKAMQALIVATRTLLAFSGPGGWAILAGGIAAVGVAAVLTKGMIDDLGAGMDDALADAKRLAKEAEAALGNVGKGMAASGAAGGAAGTGKALGGAAVGFKQAFDKIQAAALKGKPRELAVAEQQLSIGQQQLQKLDLIAGSIKSGRGPLPLTWSP